MLRVNCELNGYPRYDVVVKLTPSVSPRWSDPTKVLAVRRERHLAVVGTSSSRLSRRPVLEYAALSTKSCRANGDGCETADYELDIL